MIIKEKLSEKAWNIIYLCNKKRWEKYMWLVLLVFLLMEMGTFFVLYKYQNTSLFSCRYMVRYIIDGGLTAFIIYTIQKKGPRKFDINIWSRSIGFRVQDIREERVEFEFEFYDTGCLISVVKSEQPFYSRVMTNIRYDKIKKLYVYNDVITDQKNIVISREFITEGNFDDLVSFLRFRIAPSRIIYMCAPF